LGNLTAKVSINGITKTATLLVAQERPLDILGLDLLHKFELLDTPINSLCNNINTTSLSTLKNDIMRSCPEAFSGGLGKCTKRVKLEIAAGSTPTYVPARTVAYALREKVEDELLRLQKENIISPTNYSRWAAPIVVVRKANGNIRICANYSTGLNKQLLDHHYPVPTIEDIYVHLRKKKIFSPLDLSDAYFQVQHRLFSNS
jgi:hypothetical protein